MCALLILLSSFYGVHFGHTKRASYLVVSLLTFIEFPFLYYIYHTNTIVYMILSIAAIAIFIPAAHALIFAALAVFCDVFIVIFSYYHPVPWAAIMEQGAFYSTLCSLVISMFCVFMVTLLLKVQYEKQDSDLRTLGDFPSVSAICCQLNCVPPIGITEKESPIARNIYKCILEAINIKIIIF